MKEPEKGEDDPARASLQHYISPHSKSTLQHYILHQILHNILHDHDILHQLFYNIISGIKFPTLYLTTFQVYTADCASQYIGMLK